MNSYQLQKLKRNVLYKMAKSYDKTVSYNKITKLQYIKIILDNRPKAAFEPVKAAFEPVKADFEPVRPVDIVENYTPEFIDELQQSRDYFKQQAAIWQQKYIELLMQQAAIPVKAALEPVKAAFEPVKAALEPVKAALEPVKPASAWSQLVKPARDSDTRTISIRIKENSALDAANEKPINFIKDLNFTSRKDYYVELIRQLSKQKKILSIFGNRRKLSSIK